MAFCLKCGKELDDSAMFCSYCGQPIEQVTSTPTCSKCGKELDDAALFCPFCGQPRDQVVSTPTCSKCGKELDDTVMFCSNCGQPRNQAVNTYGTNNLLETLSQKIKTEAYVWIGVAAIQIILGIVNLVIAINRYSWYDDGTTNLISAILVWGVAALNIYTSRKDIEYSKSILTNPSGIVEKYKPINSFVITLVYNLILGGIIGVVGSIFGFITRNYVVNNEQQFLAMEKSCASQKVPKT